MTYYIINRFLYNANNIVINSNYYTYEEYVKSDNGEYLLHVKKQDENNLISFEIVSSKSKNILYVCTDEYRVYDLKSISWSGNDIIVVSGDIGTIVYSFMDELWVKSQS